MPKGKPRIYMKTRRDVTAFFYFPDYPSGDPDNLLGGAGLSVFIEECQQPAAWYTSQRQMIVESFYSEGLAIEAWDYSRPLADKMMEYGEFTAAQVDEISGHLVNGRVVEASDAIGYKP